MDLLMSLDMNPSGVTLDAHRRQTETSFSDYDLNIGYFAHRMGYPDVAQFGISETATSLPAEMTTLFPRYAPTHTRYEAPGSPYSNTIGEAMLASRTGSITADSVLDSSGSETIRSPRSVWFSYSMAASMWDSSLAERLALSGPKQEAEDGRRDKERPKKNMGIFGWDEAKTGEAQSNGTQKGVSLTSKPLKKKEPPFPRAPTSPTTSSSRRRCYGKHRKNLTATITNSIAPDDDQDKDGRHRGLKYGNKLDQRERNRIAATKWRARSKATIKHLEVRGRAVSEGYNKLIAERDELRAHVLDLRELLLQQSNCNCELISTYIQNAARLIAETGGRHPIWGADGTGGYPVEPDDRQVCHDLEHRNDEGDGNMNEDDKEAVPGVRSNLLDARASFSEGGEKP